MGSLVDLQDVTVSAGGVVVLRDLSLSISQGNVVGVSGPNGTGKSTLVETLATLRKPVQGLASVLGVNVSNADLRSVRAEIGLITHNPSLIERLTLAENLRHIARLSGNDESRAQPILDAVGLAPSTDRMASDSSFGMLRRLEVAALILRRPRLVLLDEATTGLDGAAVGLIDAVIAATVERGGAAVVVSHDANQLGRLCTEIHRLDRGRLVGSG